MLKLAILRHAKSSWAEAGQVDFDRPLAQRGLAAAPAMGRHMREIGLHPDLVLCSPAARTRETAALTLAALGNKQPPIQFDAAIYEATAEALMARLRLIPSGVTTVLLIGHNPGLQDLVLALARRPLAKAHADLEVKLPTAALVVLESTASAWTSLALARNRIAHVMAPRRLPG